MNTVGHITSLSLIGAFIVLFLTACDTSLSALPATERPIPVLLPPNQREAMRKLPFEGAHNFRDIGGYKSANGKTVKWGMVYRSDQLSNLTPEDEYYLERLNLKRIVDLRSINEREAAPNRIAPDSSIAIVNMPTAELNQDVIQHKILTATLRDNELPELIVAINRDRVEQYTLVYRAWLQSLLQDNTLPMVFHCNIGQGRTGFATAILLLALGVPKETVIADYLASNIYMEDHADQLVTKIQLSYFFQADTESLREALKVKTRYINAAFDAIDKHYGSFDRYLEEGLGLTPSKIKQLQSILLEE